jgi:hypothetical protein
MMLQTCFCAMTSTALHCTPRTAFVSLHLTALHCTPLHYTGLTEPVGGALVIDGFFAANRGYVCVVRACASRIVDNIEPPCAVTVVRRRSVAGSRGSSSDLLLEHCTTATQCAVRSAQCDSERGATAPRVARVRRARSRCRPRPVLRGRHAPCHAARPSLSRSRAAPTDGRRAAPTDCTP